MGHCRVSDNNARPAPLEERTTGAIKSSTLTIGSEGSSCEMHATYAESGSALVGSHLLLLLLGRGRVGGRGRLQFFA